MTSISYVYTHEVYMRHVLQQKVTFFTCLFSIGLGLQVLHYIFVLKWKCSTQHKQALIGEIKTGKKKVHEIVLQFLLSSVISSIIITLIVPINWVKNKMD